jgi:hypothetical protein
MDASTLAKCVIISHWLASYLTRVPVKHREQPSTASAATDAVGGRDSYRLVMTPDDEQRLMKGIMDALARRRLLGRLQLGGGRLKGNAWAIYPPYTGDYPSLVY